MDDTTPTPARTKNSWLDRLPFDPRWLVIPAAIGVGLLTWLLVSVFTGNESTPARAPAVAVSQSGLETLANTVSTPIYWAGAREGTTYELTKTADNRVYIRYLPQGVPVGSSDAYLTVGTYPVADAYNVTTGLASKSDATKVNAPGGAVAFYANADPTNVYLAYPNSNVQIEVYDPSANEAISLVQQGAINPVVAGKESTSTGAKASAVSVSGLKTAEQAVGHVVYWAGEKPSTTMELSQSSGSVYLRYLPKGVKVGSTDPYLTIGSYPVANAYVVTTTQSKKSGSVKVTVGKKGIAFYNSSRPTNVYLAYPGSAVQVEVYDPSGSAAQKLVESGEITPVP